ncbi:MAG: LytTR family DNA-binding domain-containing protein [Defluviitaleaceae bacterium]|nr:LytTR family DNA-binding domain-containing protein [Defluviitaleaceae bacterium]
MWIGICDDEAKYRLALESTVQSIAQPCDRISTYSNGSDLLDDINNMPYPMDLLLLDIEMPMLNGIETARELQSTNPNTQIIITTNHRDYALRSFEIRPSNYLIKPIDKERLSAEVTRARLIANEDIGEMLRIQAKEAMAFVPLKDVLYIESYRSMLHVHTAVTYYRYNHPIGQLEKFLSDKGFCRTHKSCLVNLRHVVSIDRRDKTALLINGKKITVGELRITSVLAEYSRYRHSMLPMDSSTTYTVYSGRELKSTSADLASNYKDHSLLKGLASAF